MRLLLALSTLALGCASADPAPQASPPEGSAAAPAVSSDPGRRGASDPPAAATSAELEAQVGVLTSLDAQAAPNAPTVTGGEVQNARVVVAGWAPWFRACYKRALGQRLDVAGRMTLVVKVAASGEVEGVAATGVVGLPDELVSCAKARPQNATFSPPVGGRATITVPLVFKPQ